MKDRREMKGNGYVLPVTVALACVGATAWLLRTLQLRKNVLTLRRNRDRTDDLGLKVLDITKFMDIDEVMATRQPFSSCRLLSASDYCASLEIPGGFDWKKAARSVLVHFKLTLLLPLTDIFIKKAKDGTDDSGTDILAYLLLRDAMSPLHFFGLGELFNVVSSRMVPSANDRCTRLMLTDRINTTHGEVQLPNPFIISEHLDGLLDGLDPDAPPDTVSGEQTLPWLPDLADASVGQSMLMNARNEKRSEVFAMLLNRLGANAFPDAQRPSDCGGKMVVQLTSDGPALTTPEGLLEAMLTDKKATLTMQMLTRITGFGYGFAAKEANGSWAQVPFAIPMRTGILLEHGKAESSGLSEVISLMTHAEICFRMHLADGAIIRMSWYQGIQGFTGWHAANEASTPWNNNPETERHQTEWSTVEEYKRAMQLAACAGCAVNRAADYLKLPSGGYGYLGVCHDSVAMVQAGLQQKVTLAPCIMAGQAMTVISRMVQMHGEAAEERGDTTTARVAKDLRAGLVNLPCDVVHTPKSMRSAIERVSATLPKVSPFKVLQAVRRDLVRAEKELDELGEGC